jgi:hypothetical protein
VNENGEVPDHICTGVSNGQFSGKKKDLMTRPSERQEMANEPTAD